MRHAVTRVVDNKLTRSRYPTASSLAVPSDTSRSGSSTSSTNSGRTSNNNTITMGNTSHSGSVGIGGTGHVGGQGRVPGTTTFVDGQHRTAHHNSSIPLFRVPPKTSPRSSALEGPASSNNSATSSSSHSSNLPTMRNSASCNSISSRTTGYSSGSTSSQTRSSRAGSRNGADLLNDAISHLPNGNSDTSRSDRPALSVQTGATPQRFLNPKSRRKQFTSQETPPMATVTTTSMRRASYGHTHSNSFPHAGLENVPPRPLHSTSSSRQHQHHRKETLQKQDPQRDALQKQEQQKQELHKKEQHIPNYARATVNHTLRSVQKHKPAANSNASSSSSSSAGPGSTGTSKVKRLSRNSISPPPAVNTDTHDGVPPVPPIPTHIGGRRLPDPRSSPSTSRTGRPVSTEFHQATASTTSALSNKRENRFSADFNSLRSKPAFEHNDNPQHATSQPIRIKDQRTARSSKDFSGLSVSLPKSQTVPDIAHYAHQHRLGTSRNHDDDAAQRLPLPPSSSSSRGGVSPAPPKSPYRPLNIPAKIYPRVKPLQSTSPTRSTATTTTTTTTTSASTSSSATSASQQNLPSRPTTASAAKALSNTSSQGSTLSDPNAAKNTYNRHRTKNASSSSITSTVRSKSTAAKAATRRMMLMSPFGGDIRGAKANTIKSSGATTTSSARTSPRKSVHPPSPPPDPVDSPLYEFTAPDNVKEILKNLVTAEPTTGETDKYLDQLRVQNRLVLNASTPAQASTNPLLNLYEKGEILDYRHIYFCGRSDIKKITGDIRRSISNYGFDDQNGDYQVVFGDHVAYRYEILNTLGKGSFGKVLKCIDHKNGQLVALKMVLNKKRLHMQALVESDLLRTLTSWDAQNRFHLVRYLDHFTFREHLCITTELLGINLYELIKMNSYRGLPLPLVRHFVTQTLEALAFLDSKSIIHCDLKPENLMLCDAVTGRIKLIDFGSSCYESARIYTYIQSRFYRSPEVMLGMQYGRPIDMWSLGCITPELLTGIPLFMGENEQEQVACIMEVRGIPEPEMLFKCSRRRLFFDSFGAPIKVVSKKGKTRRPNTKPLNQVLKTDNKDIIDFIEQLLTWDPKKRIRAADALELPFITNSSDHRQTPDSLLTTKSSTASSAISQTQSSRKKMHPEPYHQTNNSTTRSNGPVGEPPKVPIHKTLPKDTRVRSVPAWN